MSPVILATEDALSEAIGFRLLSEINVDVNGIQCVRKDGAGYLHSKIDNWKALARLRPVLLITDLDRVTCAPHMRRRWLGNSPTPGNLLMRIAVREIESWILADHEAMRMLVGARGKLPASPDELPDPKSHLLQIAKHAPRDIRTDMIKAKGAVASQGIGYNARLRHLVMSSWSADRAALRSQSLARTRIRLQELAARICRAQ